MVMVVLRLLGITKKSPFKGDLGEFGVDAGVAKTLKLFSKV